MQSVDHVFLDTIVYSALISTIAIWFKKKCLYIDKSDIFFPNMNDKNCLVDYEIFQVCLW